MNRKSSVDYKINNQQIIGAIKVIDGLYIGDSFAAEDSEFIFENKITKIVNCSGWTIIDHFKHLGV